MTVGSGLFINPGEQDTGKIVKAIQQLIEGRSNAVGTFSLVAGVTTTTVTAVTASPSSVILLSPITANAAAAVATTWISAKAAGTFTVIHVSAGTTDRTFDYAAIG